MGAEIYGSGVWECNFMGEAIYGSGNVWEWKFMGVEIYGSGNLWESAAEPAETYDSTDRQPAKGGRLTTVQKPPQGASAAPRRGPLSSLAESNQQPTNINH